MPKSDIRELTCQPGMIHFAAEYPLSAHPVVSDLTDYEFLIALIAIKKLAYMNLFTNERRVNRYRIVDSGVFEDPANPPKADKLYEIALALDADEVVAVDHIGECQQTIDAVGEFLDLEEEFPFKVMAVPQGANLSEWFKCYNWFIQHPKIDVIGLTYYKHPVGLEEVGMKNFGIPNPYEAARLALLHMIAGGLGCVSSVETEWKEYPVDVVSVNYSLDNKITKPFHILGCGNLRAIDYYRRFPFVRSIDTSFPVMLAMEGRALDLDSKKSKFKVNFEAEVQRAEKALMAYNVLQFLRLCHGHYEEDVWDLTKRISGIQLQE